jgi:hypothetical protein
MKDNSDAVERASPTARDGTPEFPVPREKFPVTAAKIPCSFG